MPILEDFIAAFAAGGIVDKADAGVTIIGGHTTDLLRFAKTKGEMQAWRDELSEAIRGITRSMPQPAWRAIFGEEVNSPVNLSDPVVAAYYLGQLAMAEGMLADVLGHTVEDDVLERLMRPEMLRVLQHLSQKPEQSFGEIAHAIDIDTLELQRLLDEAYVEGAITSAMRGITWVHYLAPLGKQIVDETSAAVFLELRKRNTESENS